MKTKLSEILFLAVTLLIFANNNVAWSVGNNNAARHLALTPSTNDAPDEDSDNYVPSKAFHDVVKENFKKWADGDGKLEKEKLGYLLNDHSIEGEDAAALATLVKAMYKKKGAIDSSLTLQDLKFLEKSSKDLNRQYKKAAGRISHINRTLFASGMPRFENLQQGPSGNCYFFAPLGWMAKFRPEVIVGAIKPTNNGGYDVQFPNGSNAHVDDPTDAELVGFHSSSTLEDGLWVVILEKALGGLKAVKNAQKAEIQNPLLRIAFGGSGMELIRKWSGKEIAVINLSETNLVQIRQHLKDLANGTSLTLTGTPKETGGKLVGGHVYAVFGYEPSGDKVIVWNPWGHEFEPRGNHGLVNGYKTRHGIFKIPLDEFVVNFSNLRIGK